MMNAHVRIVNRIWAAWFQRVENMHAGTSLASSRRNQRILASQSLETFSKHSGRYCGQIDRLYLCV